MRPTPITRALRIALAIWTGNNARAVREYRRCPIAFAVDDLCETCQATPRAGWSRKCEACRAKKRRAA
jgi:hypothetical protein